MTVLVVLAVLAVCSHRGEFVLVEKVDGEWPDVALNHELVVGPLMLQAMAAALAVGEGS